MRLTVGVHLGARVALGAGLAALHWLLEVALVAGDASLVAPRVHRRDRRQALELHVAVAKVLRPRAELEPEASRLQAVRVLAFYQRPVQELLLRLYTYIYMRMRTDVEKESTRLRF